MHAPAHVAQNPTHVEIADNSCLALSLRPGLHRGALCVPVGQYSAFRLTKTGVTRSNVDLTILSFVKL